MIRLFSGDALPTFKTGWQSTYITSRFLSYGGKASFAPFYMDDDGAVMSVLNGHAILYAEQLNIEEWACFLSMHSDIYTVTASLEIAQKLAKILHCDVTEKKVMTLCEELPAPCMEIKELMPRQAYPLLLEVFGETMPSFDGWYVDVSHRIRHQNCTIAGITWENEVVSTAMTVAESPDAVVIGAVATAEKARKRGFAAQCIGYLANKNAKKEILISPKNVYAEQLYTSMGFEITDVLGQIQIRKEV